MHDQRYTRTGKAEIERGVINQFQQEINDIPKLNNLRRFFVLFCFLQKGLLTKLYSRYKEIMKIEQAGASKWEELQQRVLRQERREDFLKPRWRELNGNRLLRS